MFSPELETAPRRGFKAGPYHFDHSDAADQIPHGFAMRTLSWCELIRFQPRTQVAGLKLTADPRDVGRETIFGPKDVRVPLSYQDRSPVRPIAQQIAQEFVDRHNRLAFRWPLPDLNGGVIQPWRKASSKSASESIGLREGLGGPISATTRSRSVTKTVSPPAASRTYSLSLFLSVLRPTERIT